MAPRKPLTAEAGTRARAAADDAATATLAAIAADVIGCERCPRLRDHCAAVARIKVARYRDQEYWGRPVPGWGDPLARLLIVGLAPGAHGANRTGRMFTGDSSGDWLYAALHRHGWANRPISEHRDDGLTLTDCYISAGARCAPPDNKPSTNEFDACAPFLRRELAGLSQLRVVLALGRLAHERFWIAAGITEAGPRPPFHHGAEHDLPGGRTLIDSYHPSRQNTNTGRLTHTMWDAVFRAVRARFDAGWSDETVAR